MWYEYVFEFVKVYWRELLSSMFLLLSFILCLIRKKPVLNKFETYISALYQRIPVFIDLVEKEGHGIEKKQLVLAMCREFLADTFGFKDFDILESLASNFIEVVLTTPQKK